ncbi:NADH-quinone oxidoreductase subunit A [bacterium]|nr:NADH-quinone oxidoreductase subunit A [bacterium]
MNAAAGTLQYVPIVLLLGLGIGLCAAIFIASTLLGPRVKHPRKNMPFECGVPAYEGGSHRFSVRFYLVAILFLLFDVEVIFFFPWALVYRDFISVNSFILWEMAFFVAIFLIGYFYIRKRGALEWE